MIGLKASEQKFLLKLFNSDGYVSDIADLSPSEKTTAATRNCICRSLAEKGLVEYDSEIFRFTLSAPGRMLLSLQTTSLPVTPDELKLLRSCRGSMTAEKLGSCVPEAGRSQLVSGLVNRKLLKVTKRQILTVRLTAKGKSLCDYDQKSEALASA